MYKIPLQFTISGQPVHSLELLKTVLSNSPHRPISIPEMRVRVSIADLLEVAKDELVVSEDQYKVLRESMETFPWSRSDKVILTIIDSVLMAKPESADEPTTGPVPKRNGKSSGIQPTTD